MTLIPIEQNGVTIYKCECCDKTYTSLPFCFGADAPSICSTIPEEECKKRIQLDKSWCIIDDKYFFHRGNLIIPIIDSEEELIFGVWSSISEENFRIRMEMWNNPERANNAPYFGWLNTLIPGYENTLSIKTVAQEDEDIDSIPLIYVVEENHPLAIDQKNGITMDRVLDILSIILKH